MAQSSVAATAKAHPLLTLGAGAIVGRVVLGGLLGPVLGLGAGVLLIGVSGAKKLLPARFGMEDERDPFDLSIFGTDDGDIEAAIDSDPYAIGQNVGGIADGGGMTNADDSTEDASDDGTSMVDGQSDGQTYVDDGSNPVPVDTGAAVAPSEDGGDGSDGPSADADDGSYDGGGGGADGGGGAPAGSGGAASGPTTAPAPAPLIARPAPPPPQVHIIAPPPPRAGVGSRMIGTASIPIPHLAATPFHSTAPRAAPAARPAPRATSAAAHVTIRPLTSRNPRPR